MKNVGFFEHLGLMMKRVLAVLYARTSRALLILFNNPILFFIFLFHELKKLATHLPQGEPLQFQRNNIVIELEYRNDPNIKEMYCGSYEISTIRAMKKLIRKDSVFIDVGANIGYVSAIGLGLVGPHGEVHSFEPVPEYHRCLSRIAALNPRYRLKANQLALGENEGKATMELCSDNIGSNTMVDGLMDKESRKGTIIVDIERLDEYIEKFNLGNISLIKIDVEGYELKVLRGLSKFFELYTSRPPIICEIMPEDFLHQEHSLKDLSEYMSKYGYIAYSELNLRKRVDITGLRKLMNVVFICESR